MPSMSWTEKYRPKRIEDMQLFESTMDKLKNIIETKEMQNIIITGIPGTGKTTTILCLANALLGEHVDDGLLELNASDSRGIKSAHETEMFCKKVFELPKNISNQYGKHKIILYDEADNLTSKTQNVIKSQMEKYNNSTKFAFTCNTSSAIIESIQSRCIILRYPRLTNESIIKRLKKICESEKVTFTDEGIELIVNVANGDMRHAINQLQLVYTSYGKIESNYVNMLCDKPSPLLIKDLIMLSIDKNLPNALKCLYSLINDGNSSSDIVMGMIAFLKMPKNNINDDLCNKIYQKVSQTLFIISKGINSKLQLTSLICSIIDESGGGD